MTEVYGLCFICGRVAAHVCKLDGKQVCDLHFDPKLGICVSHGAQKRKKLPTLS